MATMSNPSWWGAETKAGPDPIQETTVKTMTNTDDSIDDPLVGLNDEYSFLFDNTNFDSGGLADVKTDITTGTKPADINVNTDDITGGVGGADVFNGKQPDFSGTTDAMKELGEGATPSFTTDDFDTDYSGFINSISSIADDPTDLTGISGVNIDVTDVKDQLSRIANTKVDSSLVGDVNTDYGSAIKMIQQAGRAVDVKALMSTGVSLQNAIDQILGAADEVSVDGLRDIDTGIAEIAMLREMGLTGITEADIDKIRGFRENNRFVENMDESLNLLRNYSIGESEVDRKIAQGQLADFDAATAANMIAERQKLFTDTTLSDSARRSALGVLNRNRALARSNLQAQMAKDAATRAETATKDYATNSAAAAQFNETQFTNDINAVSNMWSKKIDAINAAGGLRSSEVASEITVESTIADVLGKNADLALSAAVSAGTLSAENKKLLLDKNKSLADFDNQSIQNIMNSAVQAGALTRGQAQDTLTKLGIVADIDAANIANDLNAQMARGELTLNEAKEKLFQQVSLADMTNKNKEIALESAVQAGLMTSREANDALAIATAYEDTKIQNLAFKLNSLVHAGAIESDEARLILDQNIAYAGLVEAGAARDLDAALGKADIEIKEFAAQTEVWQTEVQAKTNEVAYQLQKAVEMGKMTQNQAALKWDQMSKIIDTNVKVMQAKLNNQIALSSDENEKSRLELQKIQLQDTLIGSSGGRLRAYMESAPGAYTKTATEWAKDPQFQALANSYYGNIMGDPNAVPSQSWIDTITDTMQSPSEMAVSSLREQKWYQDLETDSDRRNAEAALGTLDQIGTYGGVFKPQTSEDGGGFKIVDPASGDALLHINRDGQLVESASDEISGAGEIFETPDPKRAGDIVADDGKYFQVDDMGSPVLLSFNATEDADLAFGADANKILDIGKAHPDYGQVITARANDYIAGNEALPQLDRNDDIYQEILNSPKIDDSYGTGKTVGDKSDTRRVSYANLEKLGAGDFFRQGDVLFKFESQNRLDGDKSDSTVYHLVDASTGKPYTLKAYRLSGGDITTEWVDSKGDRITKHGISDYIKSSNPKSFGDVVNKAFGSSYTGSQLAGANAF